jgi:PST family polysaccharide transporter
LAEELQKNEFFNIEHLKKGLKGRCVRGGAVTMATQVATFFLNMGSTVILARLLTPQDFGLIAMVTSVTGFIIMFKDMGLSMATVQKAEVNHSQISTLFWINVALSIVIMLVTASLAPAIAWFYGEPRLSWIALALSVGFIFGGLTVQHHALLKRHMRFGALALIHIISISFGIAAAIISALYGASYWSLVIMQLATAISLAVCVWIASEWRPGLPVRSSGIREMLAFGGNLTGFSVSNYFARNLDNVLIGWRWGTGPLGLYSKAYGLLLLPLTQINNPLSSVAIPTLSRLQDDPERYRNYYLKAISMIAFVTMPGIIFLIVMSKEVIWFILGSQWVNASSIFSWLSVIAVFQVITNSTGWLFITQGRGRDMLLWGIIGSSLSIISFIVGLPWGAVGVAAAYSLSGVFIRTPLILWWVGRKGPVTTLDFVRVISTSLLIAFCVGVALTILRTLTKIECSISGLAISGIFAAGVTFVLYYTIPSTRCVTKDMWLLLREINKKSSS